MGGTLGGDVLAPCPQHIPLRVRCSSQPIFGIAAMRFSKEPWSLVTNSLLQGAGTTPLPLIKICSKGFLCCRFWDARKPGRQAPWRKACRQGCAGREQGRTITPILQAGN